MRVSPSPCSESLSPPSPSLSVNTSSPAGALGMAVNTTPSPSTPSSSRRCGAPPRASSRRCATTMPTMTQANAAPAEHTAIATIAPPSRPPPPVWSATSLPLPSAVVSWPRGVPPCEPVRESTVVVEPLSLPLLPPLADVAAPLELELPWPLLPPLDAALPLAEPPPELSVGGVAGMTQRAGAMPTRCCSLLKMKSWPCIALAPTTLERALFLYSPRQ
mmetsp:Transcript_42130/g.117287  ORF Transcript_42130/g.117287 Transcript_42130/m.117287 type:complete len:218 (-) Transcript_42130:554-1207(-)